jgi:uncharacterized low-complexity protein
MSKKSTLKPLAVAMGAAFVTSLAGTNVANAAENPFAMSELSSGYMVAEMAEGKCGGEKKAAEEGKCGEGKCGMEMMDADGDGKITKSEFNATHEAMFSKRDKNGDGVLDASEMKTMEGKCGAEKKADKEGKCGEGKCGAQK